MRPMPADREGMEKEVQGTRETEGTDAAVAGRPPGEISGHTPKSRYEVQKRVGDLITCGIVGCDKLSMVYVGRVWLCVPCWHRINSPATIKGGKVVSREPT